jgi:hypothetical protein
MRSRVVGREEQFRRPLRRVSLTRQHILCVRLSSLTKHKSQAGKPDVQECFDILVDHFYFSMTLTFAIVTSRTLPGPEAMVTASPGDP